MGATVTLTVAAIRQLAAPEVFARGEDYYARGAVLSLTRRGDVLQAEVQGSSYAPYQVEVTFGPRGIAAEGCSCPYDWGGACKHVVATLLAYVDDPGQVEERPVLAALVAELDRDQLQGLVLALADRQPGLQAVIDAHVEALRTPPGVAPAGRAAPGAGTAPLDGAAYRRQVRAALRSLDRMSGSEAYWHVGGVVREVLAIANQARPFIEGGDGRSALAILEAVTEEYVQSWMELDDSEARRATASGTWTRCGRRRYWPPS
jgi:hypothetical protein